MRVDKRKEQQYADMVNNHIKILKRKLDPEAKLYFPTIKPKTPEWIAWRTYFLNHLSFLPYIMQLREHWGDGEMTVPAETPEQFDNSYANKRSNSA